MPFFIFGMHVAKPQIAAHAVHRSRLVARQLPGRTPRAGAVQILDFVF